MDDWTPAPGPKRPLVNTMRALRRSFQFSGRATRAEFWWYTLFTGIAFFVAGMLDVFAWTGEEPRMRTGQSALVTAFAHYPVSTVLEALLLPSQFSVLWRRLNDIGWPGWWSVSTFLLIALDYSVGFTSEEDDATSDSEQSEAYVPAFDIFGFEFYRMGFVDAAVLAGLIVVTAFYTIAGLRRSVLQNQHGPHPYLGRTSEFFR